MRRLLFALGVLGLAGGARAADVEGRLRVSSRMLVDGNAPRDFTVGHAGANTTDLVLSLLASGEARYTAERWQLVGRYDGGVRRYKDYGDENALVQSAALEGSFALGTSLGLGTEGRAKDRRGDSRAYTDLGATAFLEYAPDARLSLRVRAGAHRFLYRPAPEANFGGPEGGFLARYRLDRRHALSVSGEFGSRGYSTLARPRVPQDAASLPQRHDTALLASVGYTYKGPVSLNLSYAYLQTDSNSHGESIQRHRLSATAGVRLPWKWSLLAQGALGLNRYPDGVYLSPDLILLDDDESQNLLSVRLVYPLNARVDLELSYAAYATGLPRSDLFYFRQVGGVGVTWRP